MKKALLIFCLVAQIGFAENSYFIQATDVDDKLDIYINTNLVYSFNRSGWKPEECNTLFNMTPFLKRGANYIRFTIYEFGKYRWNADLKVFENQKLIWQDAKSSGVKDGDCGIKYDNTIILNKY
jgi:hypothetical protein